jgi:putative addiction module CopG family antidote
MDVFLKPEMERFVTEKIEAGQFSNPSDFINAALQLFKEQEEFTPEYEAYAKREVLRGIKQLDRGEYAELDIDAIIAQTHRRMEQRKESS